MKIFFDRFQNIDRRANGQMRRGGTVTLDQHQSKKDGRRGLWKFIPLFHTALILALVFGLELVYIQIFMIAPKLKFFFVPTVILYFSAISALAYWLGTSVDRLKERELMGDEWFFNQYPLERWLNRWSKNYQSWQIRRIRQMREARTVDRPPAYRSTVTEPWERGQRGPELEQRGWLKSLAARSQAATTEADREKDREKYRREMKRRIEKELSKNGPDLPDAGLASWYETNADKRQFIQ